MLITDHTHSTCKRISVIHLASQPRLHNSTWYVQQKMFSDGWTGLRSYLPESSSVWCLWRPERAYTTSDGWGLEKCIALSQVNRVTNDDDHGEGTSQTSPKTKPITFSINNAVAKPSNSPVHHESKVTSRADSVADRKPYGQWVPIGTSSRNKHWEPLKL